MRAQSGQATIEFSGMLLWLLVAALFAWQLGLVAWSYVSATNAARTAARMYSRTGDVTSAEEVGKQSLSGVVSSGASVTFNGEQAVVQVNIPIVIPGFKSGLQVEGDADMPHTG